MRRLSVILLGLFLLSCCTHKEITPEEPRFEAQLRQVSVKGVELRLPDGGEASIGFVVTDSSYVFNYDVRSAGFQLRVMRSGGQEPTEFRIVEVKPGAEKGSYTARLADNGDGNPYTQSVCLAVANGDVVVTSSYFTVSCLAEKHIRDAVQETGLPVVYLETEGKKTITSKETYLTASLSIKGTGDYADFESASCQVRGRGNTTWSWPKKPYLIKLDKKASVLGMPKHKRWVLLANFMDRTLMRNLVSMHVSSLTSLEWTPRCVPVELVLNGKHQGSYLLIEQVRVDEKRVNVGDDGYLLESDFHYDNEIQWTDPHGHNAQWGNGVPFGIKNPDPDDISPAQVQDIKDYITKTANALYGENFADPEKGYAKYIDVASFIDYWLVFEVMCNHELGNPGSVFTHKTKDGVLYAGPCWDFDWGVLSFYTSAGRTRLVNGKAIWYERLFQDPAFKERLASRFQELLPQLETIPDYMDACETLLEKSAGLNFKMWNPADDRTMNGGKIINGDENLSFHEAVQRLKSNYRTHLQVMKDQLL